MSTLDILFLVKNRLQYTRQSLAALMANTDWSRVRFACVYEEGSTDGTVDLIADTRWPVSGLVNFDSRQGSPAGIMNGYVQYAPADIFAKIDNDVIVPPGWLDSCLSVMEAHPELDLLGIEPPASRTPHFSDRQRKPAPEDVRSVWRTTGKVEGDMSEVAGYAPCDSIGGIGLMRTRAFLENGPLRPHSTYGGFTEWQLEHPQITKGWIVPPLPLFLLDRMPTEPWVSLGKEYERRGWQREWSHYDVNDAEKLWGWWKPV